MSLAILYSRAVLGTESPLVTVEVHLSGGLPSLSIVGLPETAVRESKDRVRSALLTAGFEFPQRRITINLAPADLPKEGGRYDLAIALGILCASQQLKKVPVHEYEWLAELALSGELRGVTGVLPAMLAAQKAGRQLLVAQDNAQEAGCVQDTSVLAASHLLQVCDHLQGRQHLTTIEPVMGCVRHVGTDMEQVRGQQQARRALEVAAAGQHNLLMSGPPGSGKSLLASCLPGILPELTPAERLQVASLHSIAGLPVSAVCAGVRPYRAPHHTASAISLVGGGGIPRPGEISLAHLGVLFLDELPEFPRRVLDVLRQPLETGDILISRAKRQVTFPAHFQLLAAMNPCPCGYFQDGTGRCRCSPEQIRRYQGRLSGPLLDRIDLQIQVNALPAKSLLQAAAGQESSTQVRARVVAAWSRQLQRQGYSNRGLQGAALYQHAALAPTETLLLTQAAERLGLSARACHRILRVARTLADLEATAEIQRHHLLEALAFRGTAPGSSAG